MNDSNQPIVRRPGPGWRFVGCSTWQHDSGVRVHYLGVALMPDRTLRREYETRLAEGYIRLAGGNRKRGLMMWALALHQIQEKAKRVAELLQIAKRDFGTYAPESRSIGTWRTD
jgi:hypothetical protein